MSLFWNIIDRCKWWMLGVLVVGLTLGFATVYFALSSLDQQKGVRSNGLVPPAGVETTTNTTITIGVETETNIAFTTALYFSVVTEATLGYGDIRPIGLSRMFICIQVLLGYVVLGLFVAKLASIPGAKLREVATAISGNWIEYLEGFDNTTKTKWQAVGDLQITYDMGTSRLRASATNYDCSGNILLNLVADLRIDDWPHIRFDYTHTEIKQGGSKSGSAQFNFKIREEKHKYLGSYFTTRTSDHFDGDGKDSSSLSGFSVAGNRMKKSDEEKLRNSNPGAAIRRTYLIDLWQERFGTPPETPASIIVVVSETEE